AMYRVHGDAIEAFVGVGDLDAAERALQPLELLAARGHRWSQAIAPRGRSLVDAARGDLDAAIAGLEPVLEQWPIEEPFEQARSWLVLGMARRRGRHRAAAREALGRAHELFGDLGASLWVERTRAEVERTGGEQLDPDGLTPTERRVAELIAGGRTYRETADELFISPKTVQWNLSKVYKKLGIRSRAELPGRLSAQSQRAD
ncbi:hypothetical protein B7486_53570, partial [cyanobacterium TDX16]